MRFSFLTEKTAIPSGRQAGAEFEKQVSSAIGAGALELLQHEIHASNFRESGENLNDSRITP